MAKYYINMDVNLREGGRKAVKGKDKKLVELSSERALGEFVWSSAGKSIFNKDRKYELDFENICSVDLIQRNGIYAIEVLQGGDWEIPAISYFYMSPSGIRYYIPLKGNTINKKAKAAFGNDEDADEEFILQELKAGRVLDKNKKPVKNFDEDDLWKYIGGLTVDTNATRDDFFSRVEPVSKGVNENSFSYSSSTSYSINSSALRFRHPLVILKFQSGGETLYGFFEYKNNDGTGELSEENLVKITGGWFPHFLDVNDVPFEHVSENIYQIDDMYIPNLKQYTYCFMSSMTGGNLALNEKRYEDCDHHRGGTIKDMKALVDALNYEKHYYRATLDPRKETPYQIILRRTANEKSYVKVQCRKKPTTTGHIELVLQPYGESENILDNPLIDEFCFICPPENNYEPDGLVVDNTKACFFKKQHILDEIENGTLKVTKNRQGTVLLISEHWLKTNADEVVSYKYKA